MIIFDDLYNVNYTLLGGKTNSLYFLYLYNKIPCGKPKQAICKGFLFTSNIIN